MVQRSPKRDLRLAGGHVVSSDGQVDSSLHGDFGGLPVGEASRIEQRCRQSKAISHLQIPAHVDTLNCYSKPLFRRNNGT